MLKHPASAIEALAMGCRARGWNALRGYNYGVAEPINCNAMLSNPQYKPVSAPARIDPLIWYNMTIPKSFMTLGYLYEHGFPTLRIDV